MKIALINTYDVQGGAARAAFRLHKGFLQCGADSRMLVQQKFSKESSVLQVNCDARGMNEDQFSYVDTVQKHYINTNRTDISNTLFSLPYPGYDLSMLPEVRQADVINLHWIGYYQSPLTLRKLFELGKPVIWTLHDQWAFTGGCHYSAGCVKYKTDCSFCPQLAEDPFGLPSEVLHDKRELFQGANLTIVCPSRWLGQCAKESMLFKDLRVETIPNPLETDIFAPVPKREAKRSLNIPGETTVLLVGAESNIEKRKGFHKLTAALHHCKADAGFQRLVGQGNIAVMCIGHSSPELEQIGVPVITLGYVDSDQRLRDIYSAADIFILPSIEDNLPNTMVEALSCGTPVIAFNIGGMPDVITHGINGRLVPAFDTKGMADAILDLVFAPAKRDLMGQNGSSKIAKQYSLKVQAAKYLALFDTLQPLKRSRPENEAGSAPETDLCNGTAEVRVPCSASTGPSLRKVFPQITMKALKREIVDLEQQRSREKEALLQQLQASEQGKTDAINYLKNEIDTLHKLMEQEKNNLIAHMQQEIGALKQHFLQEKDALLKMGEEKKDIISNLRLQKDALETFDGAFKVLTVKVLKKAGLFVFAQRHKGSLRRIYGFIGFIRKSTAAAPPEATIGAAGQSVTISSPLIEAFIDARPLPGKLDEHSLVAFYELGSGIHEVLCINPHDDIIQALYMLTRAGARVTCLNWKCRDDAAFAGFTRYEGNFEEWMIKTGNTTLLNYDCIVLDRLENEAGGHSLKGRLWPNTTLIVDERASGRAATGFGEPAARMIGPFAVYHTPPDTWLDPTPKELATCEQQDWPYKSPVITHAETLPSGRAWPRISIVTVTFNQGDFLEETIRSVLLEGYPNLEYIVIDGGSTDNTPTILNRYRSELTHCISEKDKGQSDALNKGFKLATGDILAWLNSDDRYLPGTLWRVAQSFDAYDADIVAGGCALVQGQDRTPLRTHHNAMPFCKVVSLPLDRLLDIDGSWQKGDFFYQPEVFWSRKIWERSGGQVAEHLFYSMDYELWLRMARSGATIVHIPDTLTLFRMHEKQKTSGDAPFLPELREVSRNFRRTLP
jgi:glycosyltransferase involved in cell wall biosynthesis/GT2 family glycosyltransferase